MGLDPAADLKALPQKFLEERLLWQAADELRRYQEHPQCGADFGVVHHKGA